MNKLRTLLLFAFICTTSVLLAQKATIEFDTKEHNFGSIKEEKGIVTHKFIVTNKGKSPLILKNVVASCGCTSPSWTKKPIAPNQKGEILVKFNPRNRSNNFNKHITVICNAQKPVHILRVKGHIIPRVKTIAELYPKLMDGLRIKRNHVSLLVVLNTEKKVAKLPIYNDSKENLTLSFKDLPKHISVSKNIRTLKPKQKDTVEFIFDAKLKNNWDFVRDYVYFVINGKSNNQHRIIVSATIREDFSKLTEKEKDNAPIAIFDSRVFDFGKTKVGTIVSHTFMLENKGKNNLIIRRIRNSCGCTTLKPEKKIIKPGEKIKIKATFNTRGRRGRQNKIITVITNDPRRYDIKLRISGTITQ